MEEFIAKVARMRELQKQYFKSRDPHTLQACKKIECEVDNVLALVGRPAPKPIAELAHPTLF